MKKVIPLIALFVTMAIIFVLAPSWFIHLNDQKLSNEIKNIDFPEKKLKRKEMKIATTKKGDLKGDEADSSELLTSKIKDWDKDEIEKEIAEIDEKIDSNHFVESFNQGTLSESEKETFLEFLKKRDIFFRQLLLSQQ